MTYYMVQRKADGHYLSQAYSGAFSWIGFDAHAATFASRAEALAYAERGASARLEDIQIVEVTC